MGWARLIAVMITTHTLALRSMILKVLFSSTGVVLLDIPLQYQRSLQLVAPVVFAHSSHLPGGKWDANRKGEDANHIAESQSVGGGTGRAPGPTIVGVVKDSSQMSYELSA
jgi:hypothetical protein